ncbi:hypothetical protein BJX99DRAFT_254209 [Aspergillus californicus]
MPYNIIDPYGDIIIDCSGKGFRVSSKALSLASPVFRAMFLPRFKEGIIVASNPTDLPVIELPGDHSKPFRLFCNAAHHRKEFLPPVITLKTLRLLATFVDKYKCRSAMQDRGLAWLKYLESKLLPSEALHVHWVFMLFAYSMDLDERFARYCRQLMIKATFRFSTWDYALKHSSFLPKAVVDALDNQVDSTILKIEDAIEDSIKFASKARSGTRKISADALAGHYLCALGRAGVLPGTEEFETKTIEQIMNSIYPPYTLSEDEWLSWEGLLMSKISNINTLLGVGLCLTCLKTPDLCPRHPFVALHCFLDEINI